MKCSRHRPRDRFVPPGDGNIGPVRVASLRLATYGIQDLRVRRRSASISNVKKWRYPPRPSYLAPFVATGHSTSVDASRRRALGYFLHGALAIITVDRGAKGPAHHFAWLLVALCVASGPIALRRRYSMPVLFTVTVALTAVDDARPGIRWRALRSTAALQRRGSQRPTDITDDAPRRRSAVARGARAWPPSRTNRRRIFIQRHRGRATWIVADSVRARRAHHAGLAYQVEQRRSKRRTGRRTRSSKSDSRSRANFTTSSPTVSASSRAVRGGRHVLENQPMRPESPWPLLKSDESLGTGRTAWVGRSLASR